MQPLPTPLARVLLAQVITPLVEALAGLRPAHQVEPLVSPALAHILRRPFPRSMAGTVSAHDATARGQLTEGGEVELWAVVKVGQRYHAVAGRLRRTPEGRIQVTDFATAEMHTARCQRRHPNPSALKLSHSDALALHREKRTLDGHHPLPRRRHRCTPGLDP